MYINDTVGCQDTPVPLPLKQKTFVRTQKVKHGIPHTFGTVSEINPIHLQYKVTHGIPPCETSVHTWTPASPRLLVLCWIWDGHLPFDWQQNYEGQVGLERVFKDEQILLWD